MADYTSVRLRSEPIEKLRRLTRLVSVALDRDVQQSDVLEAITDYGLEHVAEVAERIGGSAAPS